MEKKTHVACANLISLSLIRPSSIQELLITVGVSTLGGLLPDVDLKDSTSDKIFDRLMTSLITIIIMSIIINHYFNINLYNVIKGYNNIFNYIICLSLFIIMSYLGSKTPHRSFTHSFLGLFIYSAILSYSFNDQVVTIFFISYLSHLILDLLNKKGLTLFYPLKNRLSLNLCEVKGTINKILFITSSILNIVVLILISIE